MCLPFKYWFSCVSSKELTQEEIERQRLNMLPFTWKYSKKIPIKPTKKSNILVENNEQA